MFDVCLLGIKVYYVSDVCLLVISALDNVIGTRALAQRL